MTDPVRNSLMLTSALLNGGSGDLVLTLEAEVQKLPKPPKIDKTKFFRSPMPGTLMSVKIKAGDTIKEGQEVCVVEAMKMQNVFVAKKGGVVKGVYAEENTMIKADDLIYDLE